MKDVWIPKFSMMRIAVGVLPAVVTFTPISATRAAPPDFQVHPGTYDPANTDLVASLWVKGAGCPTGAVVAIGVPTPTGPYTDPACLTGDPKDNAVEGLLLVKTGPTSNYAAAVATITGLPKNLTLTELGYDIRKPVSADDARGSHCGAGAPRFNITTTTGFYFLGCNSPPATTQIAGNGWVRLRWTGTPGPTAYLNGIATPVTGTVQSIEIVFDEGQDTGPDYFGAAVLDNIDINGTLVGQGPEAH